MTDEQQSLLNEIGNQLDSLYETFTILEVDIHQTERGVCIPSTRNLIEEEFRVRTMEHSRVARSLEEWCNE